MNIATTKKRLMEFLDFKGISVPEFYKNTGIKRGFLDGDKLHSAVSDKFLAIIIENYSRLNLIWLVSGYGQMLVSEKHSTVVEEPNGVYRLRSDNNLAIQKIPLYEIEASAGLVKLFTDSKKQIPVDFISIPNLPKCDGAVPITGDSMYPLLKSGDIVMYKEIQDLKNDIFFGEMYLIGVEVSGDEHIMVKFVQKSEKGNEWIKLVSHNPHHQDKDISLKKVRAMAIVKASIRINSMQ
jgi:hypothetical protein